MDELFTEAKQKFIAAELQAKVVLQGQCEQQEKRQQQEVNGTLAKLESNHLDQVAKVKTHLEKLVSMVQRLEEARNSTVGLAKRAVVGGTYFAAVTAASAVGIGLTAVLFPYSWPLVAACYTGASVTVRAGETSLEYVRDGGARTLECFGDFGRALLEAAESQEELAKALLEERRLRDELVREKIKLGLDPLRTEDCKRATELLGELDLEAKEAKRQLDLERIRQEVECLQLEYQGRRNRYLKNNM